MQRNRANNLPESVGDRIRYFDRTSRLLRHLERHLNEPLGLERAASIAGMERTAFARFFRRYIGMTFAEFVRAYRIAVAKRELLRGDASLEQVASAVGYRSMTTFDRHFKKETGTSPSRFRAETLARREATPAGPRRA